MNSVFLFLILSFTYSKFAYSENHYFEYTKECVQRYTREGYRYDPFYEKDAICTFLALPRTTIDLLTLPTMMFYDLYKWTSDISSAGPNSSTQSSQEGTKSPSQTSSAKSPTEKEIPEERKFILNKLSLFLEIAHDSMDYLNYGVTTPLLISAFHKGNELFSIEEDLSQETQFKLYAYGFIQLNRLILNDQLEIENN